MATVAPWHSCRVRSLIALDIHGGDRFTTALRRIWDSGDAVLPFDTHAPTAYQRLILEELRPAAIEDADGVRTQLSGSAPVDDGDAVVMATSGTTGVPKGVVHTHSSVEAAARLTARATGTTAASRWVACLPLSHVGGFSVVTRALLGGCQLSVHDGFTSSRVDLERLRGATHVSLVPTVLGRIDPMGWQVILLGGSAIPVDRPVNSVATYGMTESFGGVVYDGIPLAGVDVRTTAGGIIEIRSPTLFRGYRTTLEGGGPGDVHVVSTVDAEGFYATGDIGSLDADTGVLTVAGRSDDLIITGGVKIWPEPVERVLVGHPLVGECAIVGRPDPEWGQAVVAVVVPRRPDQLPALEELRDLVRSRLPRAAAPREVIFTESLPLTALGKVRRRDALFSPRGTYDQ